MKTEKNILVAFLLNISFSISYILEKKSKKKADNNYTYGYIRYSVLGGVITTTILLVGSILVIIGAIKRLFNPVDINYNGMIIFAIIGVVLNFLAAYITREGDSINQKSVNLHMLEDVLGWIVVLVGAIIMNFTDIKIIDPIMSILVACFILINALKNLKLVLDLFLEKTPKDIDIEELKKHLLSIDEVDDIHHIHIWSMDGYKTLATMHIVTKSNNIKEVKRKIREELSEHNICHAILETEEEACDEVECHIEFNPENHHHHHHH